MRDEEDEEVAKLRAIPPPPPSLIPPAERSLESSSDLPPPIITTKSISDVPSSPVSRSLPPMPAIEPILDSADDLRAKKDWDGALEAYKKALFVVDQEDGTAQASIYASVAEVKIAQGKPREAETNYEKALVVRPKHMRSIEGLIKLATEAKEWDRVIQHRLKKVDALEDADEKASELCRMADIAELHTDDPKRAAGLLETAGLHRPGDLGVLLKLKNLYTVMRAWTKLIDVLDELVRVSNDPRHRGTYRFSQADVVLARLRQEPRGLAFLEMALDEDPQCDRALSALVAVRTRREEWSELAQVYERLIDRFAGIGDRERAWEVCRKLATLRRDRLLDGPGALEAFRGAVELRPEDAESRAALAELYANKGDRDLAKTELEIVTKHAPLRAHTYRRLFELHHRAERPDRQWLVATCLEELGGSDVAHDLVIEQFRPDGPIRPTTGLEDEWWDELIGAPGSDRIVHDILLAVGDAATTLRLAELESKKKLPVLDPTRKQDKTSTASVVRTFVWAARALGIPLPELYLLDEVPNGIAVVPAEVPTTALGMQVRTGMTVQQLAFLAGRHLTYYRPGYSALIFFPTLADLSALVLAAVRLVIPGISVPPPPDADSKVTDALGGKLTAEKKAELEKAVARLDARGGKLDLLAWIRSVELTAARAGLLLAGDLRIAMRLMKEEERSIGELTFDAKRGDLLAYTASEEYGILRDRLGISIHPATLSTSMKAAKPAPAEE